VYQHSAHFPSWASSHDGLCFLLAGGMFASTFFIHLLGLAPQFFIHSNFSIFTCSDSTHGGAIMAHRFLEKGVTERSHPRHFNPSMVASRSHDLRDWPVPLWRDRSRLHTRREGCYRGTSEPQSTSNLKFKQFSRVAFPKSGFFSLCVLFRWSSFVVVVHCWFAALGTHCLVVWSGISLH
jgi:hypothetical protein